MYKKAKRTMSKEETEKFVDSLSVAQKKGLYEFFTQHKDVDLRKYRIKDTRAVVLAAGHSASRHIRKHRYPIYVSKDGKWISYVRITAEA